MNERLLTAILALGVTFARGAIVYDYSNTAFDIPDGSPIGSSASVNVSGAGASLTDVRVTVNISGGYNGDLYAYLSYNGTAVTLLNRVGVGSGSTFGYSDSGFAVTFASSGSDIHYYNANTPTFANGQLTGTWQADGRTISPFASASSFDSAPRLNLSTFNGINPNGTWTLFIADVSGGAQSRLESWDLDLTAVPEPVNITLTLFGGIGIAACMVRRFRSRR
jgi:subtilisin-like proprotein convertase family protein